MLILVGLAKRLWHPTNRGAVFGRRTHARLNSGVRLPGLFG